MRKALDYCYYFCYQFAMKNKTPGAKERAVFGVMIQIIALQLLAFSLVRRLIDIVDTAPIIINTTVFVIMGVGIDLIIYNKLERYFLEKNRFRAITTGRYKAIKTPVFVDFLIIIGVSIGIILLSAIIALSRD